ncbi:hypothetical protein BCR32DRAFT_1514 [Anaeromyces robustus]|uniref:non-specific serine/threonine protein kinase n=1 Tax=Anaeromyces robustus TaxID=1754192 RepID=A0A1Y1XRB9_9FUNG|nr:hypothetical protein BCR32DRAFT_1514 [Anaeromyces robustus]|eukprot:ORX88301.1 hypothetical protein BCR32DRAFT_1514 [Anaeromyces robustus]
MPEYLSSDAKNLISRMLVVEPSKRIKMSEIMKHPWFVSIPPKAPYLPAALETVGDTAFNPDMLDEEILKSLHLIGWGDEEQLKEKLSNNESNYEKVFYALLLQRKTNFFENYDINKLTEWDIEGGPRRRTESYNNLLTDRNSKDIYKSVDTLTVSPLGTSPNSLGSSSNTMCNSCINVMTGNKSESPSRNSLSSGNIKSLDKQTSREELIKRQQKNAVHVNSPLATNLVNNNNIESPQKTSPPVLDHSPQPDQKHHTPNGVYNNINISTEELNNHINNPSNNKPKPLSINIPKNNVIDEIKGGGNRMSLNLQVGTPRFHRRRDFPIPPSPVITSTPKKSWFANLFNFKPEAVTLLSQSNVEETSSMIQDLMESLDIKYQVKRDNGFKCKWDGGQVPATVLATAKGQVVGGSGREESTLIDSSNSSSSNKRASRFSTHNNSNNSNVSTINNDIPKVESPVRGDECSLYATPTSAKTTKSDEDPSSSSLKDCSAEGPLNMIPSKDEMILMKSVKFKIDIIPLEDNNGDKASTKVIFTQQQGSYSSFQVVVFNIKSTWETCEKESLQQ